MKNDISGIAKSILSVRESIRAESAGSTKEPEISVSFMELMNQNGTSPNVGTASDSGELISRVDAGSNATQEAYKPYSNSVKSISVKEEASPEEMRKEASGMLEDYEAEIRGIIEEELGVTEEEIDKALESLGLSICDLSNLQDLTALIQELTGENIGALFLSEAFQNVKNLIVSATEELCAELGITKEEWNILTEAFEQTKAEEQADTAVQMPAPEEAEKGSFEAAPVDAPVSEEKAGQTEPTSTEALQKEAVPQEAADAAETAEQEAAETAEALTRDTSEQKSSEAPKEQAAAVSYKAEQQPEEETVENVSGEPKERAEISAQKLTAAGEEAENASPKAGEWQQGEQQEAAGQQQTAGRSAAGTEHFNAVLMEGQAVRTEEFAVPQPEAAVPYSSQADAMNLIEQIARNVRVTISSELTSMEMQLNPENLGKIYLNITEKEGAVRAQIAAQNQNVKEALETQVAELRQSLNQQGIKVDAIEVTIASHEFEQNLEEHARQEEQLHQQMEESRKNTRRSLNLNDLDELAGLMTEEEQLAAQIMRDNGNQVDLTA